MGQLGLSGEGLAGREAEPAIRVSDEEVVMQHDELGPLMRRRLAATIDELSVEFHGVFSRGTVERFVHESSDRLGDRPTTGPNFLPLLVGDAKDSADRRWLVFEFPPAPVTIAMPFPS